MLTVSPPLSTPVTTIDPAEFGPALVAWHGREGRHDLPWQHERTAYRVWVSEIMLQQTQVSTVIPYFERFMSRFPTVEALAAAALDDVLHLWTGLGYYARARNLHRAARELCASQDGRFPREFTAVAALPGIGRSTAGAILALAHDERHAILDGNVKRVLTRVFAIEGHPSERLVEQRLWSLAEACTPHREVATYTQAIMDLGATICTRRRPACERCPLVNGCAAYQMGRQHELPAARVRKTSSARRKRECWWLVRQDMSGAVWLERRPERGIWGGLWCPPQFDNERQARVVCPSDNLIALSPIEHVFTHFDLRIHPLLSRTTRSALVADSTQAGLWYNPQAADATRQIGLPAPVKAMLDTLQQGFSQS
ncbi:MAG: A/G-specific adenine glycosylase [Steroidobacteraceae bacterium]